MRVYKISYKNRIITSLSEVKDCPKHLMEKIYESIYIFMKHDGGEATYWINIDESEERIDLKKNSNIIHSDYHLIHKLIKDSKSYLREEKITSLLNQIQQ